MKNLFSLGRNRPPPSFRRKPESRAEENGDAPVFHPSLIGGNTKEIKKQRQGEMSRVGDFWIPACAGMTIKSEGRNHLPALDGALRDITTHRDFFNNPMKAGIVQQQYRFRLTRFPG